MKPSQKDIKTEFFKDDTRYGELTPIIYKNGKLFIPTADGFVTIPSHNVKKITPSKG